jgi:hypothetical protein
MKTIYYGNHITGYTGLETCEGCGKLHSDQVIPCHDLGLCPDCQKLGIYVACCSCRATLNTEEGEAISVELRRLPLSPTVTIKNAHHCDACYEHKNEPFEMDWQYGVGGA